MFGSKLRSWMEAVRPRKKQNRKEKQCKSLNPTNAPNSPENWRNVALCGSSRNDISLTAGGGKIVNKPLAPANRSGQASGSCSRYSANNLSSPESAYSTGYSTDGTSPGAPPDYYINIRTGIKYFPAEGERIEAGKEIRYFRKKEIEQNTSPCPTPVSVHQIRPASTLQTQEVTISARTTSVFTPTPRLPEAVASPVLTSPRQRTRIRTNPWLPGSTLSPNPIRQGTNPITKPVTDSPIQRRFLSPSTAKRSPVICQSLSSSSCSSLSAASVQWDVRASGSEDDCTLNEMMGKYDESYVYEKETDILSDSDPTDCDTDIDTGQDGGDEDESVEREFDFIDNGSYLELDPRDLQENTGHCTYYNFDSQRRNSRRRTTRRNKASGKRRRSTSNKKRHKEATVNPQNGSKSAGATPLSVRRTKHPLSKLALEDCLKKRSNSVSCSRDPISTIDKRDKEADRKYKELIIEAEQLMRSMKINGLSPRRGPVPANKRVEILRSTECAKPDLFIKNKLLDEAGQFTKIPSINNSNCPRFSPKKNHITNFINSNTPIRRDLEASPLVKKPQSPQLARRDPRRSPKYRKKVKKSHKDLTSSESDDDKVKTLKRSILGCPQSEPVRRKVYAGHGKTVAFNLTNQSPPYSPTRFEKIDKSCVEDLRQQVLLNTIASLKRNLEDQSASLKQVYNRKSNTHL